MVNKKRILVFLTVETCFFVSLFLSYYCTQKLIPIVSAVICFIMSPIVFHSIETIATAKRKILISIFSFVCYFVVLLYSLFETLFRGNSKILLLLLGVFGSIFSISLIIKSYKEVKDENNNK